MRILAAACAFALLGAAPVFAQMPGLGIKGGVNLATQKNTGDGGGEDLKMLPAVVGGVFATFPLTSWLEFQPEALYSVKGARAGIEGITAKLLIDYLEVPMLARFSRRGGGLGYYVAGGPSAAFQIRARTRTKFSGSTDEIDVGDEIERLDFGAAIGGGVEIGALVIDGRYTHGLKDIDKDKSDGVKVTNRAVTFTAGYRF